MENDQSGNDARDLETRVHSRSSSKAENKDFVAEVVIHLNFVRSRATERPKEPAVSDVHNGQAVENEASRDPKGEGQEMKTNRGRMQWGAGEVREYLLRLVRKDKEKQIQENRDVIVEDVERAVDQFMDEYMVKPERPPPYLCDLWSHQIYKDPVVTPSGFTYERSGIEDHLKNVGEFDPVTHVKLTADLLIPNYAMKKLVDIYMAGQPDSPMPSGSNSSERLPGPEPS